MTIKELSQLYHLSREIKMDTMRLEELKEKAVSCTGGYSGTSGCAGCKDKVGRYAADIVDLQGVIDAKIQRCIYERNALERYIADIPDSLTRQIFTLRFVDGLRWEQVAAKTGSSFDAVKKICYRHLRKGR